ncbi:MAG: FtsW/RodA/SpoVE family cell cycle protein, partial [Pseudomonadota bacterium]
LILAALAAWLVTHRAFREGAAPNLPGWMVTPWKRIQSWFDMALDAPDGAIIDLPETGSQLLRAREALLEVHCTLEQLCPANIGSTRGPAATEALLRLPAAQDDFAAVSLIHALGVDGAVLYFALQVAMIVAGLVIGFHALLVRVDFRFGAWLTGCIAIGMTAVVAAQIALAWGNVLGGLPIMGQPMTFVSFGASHHLGVAMPFALAIVATTLVMRAPATVDRQNRIRSMIYKRRVA